MYAKLVLIVLLLATFCFAQETSSLMVENMQICTAIEERQPAGADTAFADTVGQLYCFTKITGAEDTTMVAHVWYHGDEERARVELTIKSKTWRTWSSKRIVEGWTGEWRVDVLSANGAMLASKKFKINAAMK